MGLYSIKMDQIVLKFVEWGEINLLQLSLPENLQVTVKLELLQNFTRIQFYLNSNEFDSKTLDFIFVYNNNKKFT